MKSFLQRIFFIAVFISFFSAAFAQPANDNCNAATGFGSLPVPGGCSGGIQNGAAVTLSGQSTVGATSENPYPYITGCAGGGDMASPALDTWYSFIATGTIANINITGFPNAAIGLWSGTSCTSLTALACTNLPASGTGGLTVTSIAPGQTYYIQVSGNSSTATDGNFSIAVDNDIDCQSCLRTATLTPTPTAVNGVYAPGQVVRFCFNVTQWNQTNTNWFHGVQITMGPGWTGAISNVSPATTCQATGGSWAYYPSGIGVVNGTNWGPGFYFDSNLGAVGGVTVTVPIDGNPANNYGDNCSGAALNWLFCFDLTVSSTCVSGQNLSVNVNTSGDGESGSWFSPACQLDPVTLASAVKSPGPVNTNPTTATICSGSSLSIPLTSDVPATYTWVAADNPNTTGESTATQTTGTINNTIINTSTAAQTVSYTVIPTAISSGCIGAPQTITALVNPNPVVSVSSNTPVCTNGNAVFTLAGTPNAVVTYNINSGAAQTINLNAAGTATVTIPGVTINTTLNVILVSIPGTTVLEYGASATGGTNPANSAGVSSPAGTAATGANSALINGASGVLTVTLPRTVPAGTVITISLARNNAAGSVTITGGTTSQVFNGGTVGVLGAISFTPAVATNNIVFTRTAGAILIDGLSYNYTSPACTNVTPVTSTVVVGVPAAPTVTTPVVYCQGATASALNATGTNLLWYTVATGGTGSATAPIPLTGTVGSTIYYVTQTPGTCESPRASITVTITALPTAPAVTTPVTYCQGAAASPLTATGTGLLWYTVATGGVGSATAPTPLTGTTGSIIYYVSQTIGCEGPRAALTVNIDPTPAAPAVITPVIYCRGATASALTAPGTNLLWYTVATGGTGSATAPTPATGTTGSTIYYVTQTTGICEGPRAAITVTINTTPAAPAVTSPVTYCQGETASALTATGTNLLWYTVVTGGTGSATAPTPSTGTTGSTIYYVSQTTGICEGPRAALTVNIDPTPAAPAVITPVIYCQGETPVPLTATGTGLLWYTVATGGIGSATAPTPSTGTTGSTIYYVTQTTGICEGPRAAITVTVNITPTAPVVTTPVVYCQGATASALTATGTNLLWYTTATGGTGSATAPTPLTGTTGSTIYYVTQTTGICEGPRAAITVTVNTTPAAPGVTSPVNYCQGTTAVPLTATGTNLLWYTVATGGTGSATAPTPSTGATGSTIYYVTQTTGICEGPRTAITVTINSVPAAPAVTTPVVYCQGGTSSALTATGTNLLWYTVVTGGTGSATAPTPATGTTGSTIYYVSQTSGCEGPRAAISVTVNATPAAPAVTSPVIYCEGATASALTATGTNLLWYTVATGGAGSATAPTPSTGTTGSTIYYVSQTAGICEGPRAAITVTVNTTPTAPGATTPVTYCEGATASALTATGTNLLWYTVATGGAGSATAPTPSTGTTGSTIYYVSQTTGICEGPRAAITVTINATPPTPAVTTSVAYCEGATASALTATGTNLLWYTVATGGTGSATAPIPSTGTVGSTIYYVSQTTGTCEGPRAAITVIINATPSAPAVTTPVAYCRGAIASALTATGTNLLWYTTATGGTGSATAPTPSTSTVGSTIYYVSQSTGTCEGPRAAITVTINALPAAPAVTTPIVYCQGATATALTATGTNLLWYTAATGGTGSATAPTPSTATTGSTIYYVSQTTGTCEGPRAAITVTINTTPAAPAVTSPVTYCQNATASSLTATGSNLLWYTAATGGTGSATAPTPSTGTTGSTIYYVSQTTGICEGPRAAITVTVNSTPAAPAITTPVVYCQGATASTLTATGTNLLWYTVATGGTGSATAPTPSTAVTGSTIYYVSQATGTCEGARAAITVTINTTPAAPTVTSPVSYCQGATASALTATGTNLLWYTTATGGTGSATAPTPSTTTVGSIVYYVSQTTGICEGPRAAITVTINSTPAAPAVTTPVVYCQGTTASALTATGTNLLWYTNAAGGTGSAGAPTPATGTVGSTIYYVSQTTGTCEGPRAAITVTINTVPAAPAVTTPVIYCQGATATALTATGTNLLWYTVATGGTGSATAPTPATGTTGSTIYYVSQTTGTCEGPRAAITVTINTTPVAPTVSTPVTYCRGATAAALTATGTNLLWYTAATGGSGSATAPTPSTAATGSTIYYVSQSTVTCEGPRAAITVTVNATPIAPAVTTPVIYCQNATAAALTATGTNLLWYTTATGGTGSATAPTPATTSVGSTIYYVSQTTGTCEGPRAAITVTINALPAAPVVTTPVIYCQGATATALTATGTNLLWYTVATAGTGSATAPTPSSASVGSTIYYVSQTTGTCEGPRAAITVTINATPLAPSVTTPVTYCQGTIATALTATGTNLLWYTTATGGTGSATAPTPSTVTTGSTIYYVSQTTGICEGPRAAITVTVNTTPAAPTVSSPVLYCQSATATALTATGTNILWYTTATGGTASATAPTPATGTTGSTNYYVSQTTGTCEGPRAAITVTVNAAPAAPTVTTPVIYCQGVTATALTAAGTNLLWYTTPTGGTGSATAPTPATGTTGSTIYYVSQTTGTCEGPRAAITVTINPTPAAPAVTTPVTYCRGAVASGLIATGTGLLWYTAATGGTGSATAPTPSTATPGNTIYYVSQTTGTCEGPRAVITVTINPLPAAPTVTSPVTYCQNTTAAALTATGTNLLWYTTATGGTGSATAPTPSTATAGNTIYYVSQTTTGCEGPRASITVTVNAIPAAPTVTSPLNYCQGATALPLNAAGSNFHWYTTATGGTGTTIPPTPSTATVGSTTYYVTQTITGCEGPRAPIVININPVPGIPVVVSPVAYCRGAASFQLTATGTNLLWYAAATGGTGSATAPTPATTTAGSTLYYVSQSNGSCEGPRAAVTVTINPAPSVNIGIDTAICQGDSMHFIPTVTPEADSYAWRSITAGVPNSTISSSNTKETTVGPVNTVQYVLHAVYQGCAAEDTALVTVRWKPIVDAGANAAICPKDSVLITGTVTHFASTAITYAWTPTDSLTTATAIQTWAHPAQSTWYSFTATTTKAVYGCDFSVHDSVKVVVQPPVHAFAGNDTIAMSGVAHQLYGSGGAYYFWSSPTATINNPTHQNPTAMLTGDANFFLMVKDAIGCTGYDSVFVKLYDGPTFYVPGAFTPNGDGLNDILRPVPSGISTITYFRVYNRYGQLMFETNQYLKGWDGTYSGKPQVNGTYIWTVKGVDRNRRDVELKGTVILIR